MKTTTSRPAPVPREKTRNIPAADPAWRIMYAIGGISAFLYVLLVVIPLVLLVAAPQPPVSGGAAVLEYIAGRPGVYMAELICFVGLAAPALVVFLAAAVSVRNADRSLAAIGGLLGIGSEVIALAIASSPPSLHAGLVSLGARYASAAPDARAALAASADALVSAANAVSAAGILTAAGILFLSLAMRKGVYHRAVAYIGIVTGALGIVAEAFRPLIGMAYAIFGLLLPVWFLLVGLKLFALRKE